MKNRGEKHYIRMPRLAAKLYDNLTNVKGVNQSFEEIADFLGGFLHQGTLLDIGMGTGRLLAGIHSKNPQIEIYGLDISPAMLNIAAANLKAVGNVFLRVGSIEKTEFTSGFFDCIVTTGSFYNWDKPVEGLNEMFRILKTDKTAYIFESIKDYDKKLFRERMNENLKGYNILRKSISKYFLKKQLRMTYGLTEIEEILRKSKFNDRFRIQQITLGNLPVYVRIELNKL